MSKTTELRKVIQTQLTSVANRVYFAVAPDDAAFPYIVYDLESIDYGNYPRNDVILTVDVWDRSTSTKTIENLADSIDTLLDHKNNPTPTVLPTFYLSSRQNIIDEDKSIKRRQLKFQIQNYYLGGETIDFLTKNEDFYVLKEE